MNRYFIQKIENGVLGTQHDVETFFGLNVIEAKGLTNIGNVKGVIEEDFAEKEGLNVYVHKNQDGSVNLSKTEFTLDVFFPKENRYTLFSAFVSYLVGGEFYLSDTVRGVKVRGFCLDSIEPTDYVYDEQEYLRASIKFKNTSGNFETI